MLAWLRNLFPHCRVISPRAARANQLATDILGEAENLNRQATKYLDREDPLVALMEDIYSRRTLDAGGQKIAEPPPR